MACPDECRSPEALGCAVPTRREKKELGRLCFGSIRSSSPHPHFVDQRGTQVGRVGPLSPKGERMTCTIATRAECIQE